MLDPCPEELMQPLSREVNLSETAFPTVVARDRYDLRIFTPGVELPFAGHPSLGTAWVLGPNRWTQVTRGATVTVESDERGAVMSMPDAVITEIDAGPLVAALVLPGAEAAFVAEAGGNINMIVATEEPIDGLEPDFSALGRVAPHAAAVVRRGEPGELHVRVFLPGSGITEDPGTGSAAGPIALVASRVWGTGCDVVIRQGIEMGRPCRIEVHAEEGAARVGGAVSLVAEGRFTL